MTFIPPRRWTLAIALLLQVTSLPAFAALGADVASIATDELKMKGMARVSAAQAFSVHEIATPAGTRVREYVSPAGKVFAVSWRGPKMPDLKQTLGVYFEQFSAAPRSGPSDRKHFAIALPDLVLQSSAHGRSYAGRAYVPALVPQNVSVTDIK
jgi:Protein of unknown function (DUF2844)